MKCLELAVSSRLPLNLIHAFNKYWLFATILFSPGCKFTKKGTDFNEGTHLD